jgi:uncharacterized membrane protein YoaK (UPF0700 family)
VATVQATNLTKTSWLTHLRCRWLLPVVLSTTAGAVDVIGFLALGGLFTAHITGNMVIVAVHYVRGGFCQVGPLLAVPVFMAVLGLATLASGAIARAGLSPLRPLLALQAALLAGFLGLGVGFGRFPDVDSPMAVFAGMLGVAAMATQTATVKLAIKQSPSTAVMTTNISQLTVDIATITRGQGDPEQVAQARQRARVTIGCILGFVGGCAAGAALEVSFGFWALTLPVVLAALAVPLGRTEE